jgi:LytR cell envelope-related transcriptional attenuator
MARQLARRHQRERIAGILVVCLGLVVLAVAMVALREPNGHVSGSGATNVANGSPSNEPSQSPPTSPSGSASSDHAPSLAELKAVPLVVLNNSSVVGLAAQAAQQFESGGWSVTRIADLQNEILSPCAYYDPSATNAREAAKALQRQFPGIDRVKPKFPELPSGPIVVVLTADYTTT